MRKQPSMRGPGAARPVPTDLREERPDGGLIQRLALFSRLLDEPLEVTCVNGAGGTHLRSVRVPTGCDSMRLSSGPGAWRPVTRLKFMSTHRFGCVHALHVWPGCAAEVCRAAEARLHSARGSALAENPYAEEAQPSHSPAGAHSKTIMRTFSSMKASSIWMTFGCESCASRVTSCKQRSRFFWDISNICKRPGGASGQGSG